MFFISCVDDISTGAFLFSNLGVPLVVLEVEDELGQNLGVLLVVLEVGDKLGPLRLGHLHEDLGAVRLLNVDVGGGHVIHLVNCEQCSHHGRVSGEAFVASDGRTIRHDIRHL